MINSGDRPMKYDIDIEEQLEGSISDVFDGWDFMETSMLRTRLLTIFGFGYERSFMSFTLNWYVTENGLALAAVADMFLDSPAV